MEKEEILKKAQEENKGNDMADLEAQRKGAYIAYFVGVIGVFLVTLITYWVSGSFNYGPIAIIFLMAGVAFLIKYISLKKKHELLVASIYGLSFVIFLTLWILQLCQVI